MITDILEKSQQMMEGKVQSLDSSCLYKVQLRGEDTRCIDCRLLRITEMQPVKPKVGDEVLVAVNLMGNVGYIVGVVSDHDEALDNKPRQIVLDASERVEIRCGESCIVLKGDGSVVVRGLKITSRSRGVHKIKGAAVEIN